MALGHGSRLMGHETSVGGGAILRTVHLQENEEVRRVSWTTHSRGWLTGVAGKLFLTDRRLIFCPVRYPIPIRPSVCYLSEIRSISLVGWSDWPWLWHRMTPQRSLRLVVDARKYWFFLGREKSRIWAAELAELTRLDLTNGS